MSKLPSTVHSDSGTRKDGEHYFAAVCPKCNCVTFRESKRAKPKELKRYKMVCRSCGYILHHGHPLPKSGVIFTR